MPRLRIGVDGGLISGSRPTGVEHFARGLLQAMMRLDTPDVDWCLYLPPFAEPGEHPRPNWTVRRRPDVNTLIKRPWLIAQTWRDRPDYLYSFGHLQPRGCAGRSVVTVHDLAFEEFPETYPVGAPEVARSQVREACSRAERIVVPSEATRSALVERYRYPPERVHVILEGARECFQPGPPGELPAAVRDAGIRPPFLLTVGRLDARKNAHRVIDAYRSLLAAGVDCGGLVIVGPDDSGSELVRRRMEEGPLPAERIVCLGYVGDAELVHMYRAAAVLVYPSLAEGFGLPVLEAMACGTPVITSNVSSLPEVGGDACLQVDPRDGLALEGAIRSVLTDRGLADDLRSRGLTRAAGFTWDAAAQRLLRVFRGELPA